MTGRLQGKVALITDATGGIGTATAESFAREGARLTLTDAPNTPLSALTQRLGGHGVTVTSTGMDVSSASAWTHAVDAVRQHFGQLDVLVDIAGILSWEGIEDTDEATQDRVIAVNQKGTWLGMKATMPLLLAAGHASVINTSTILGVMGSAAAAAYQASKGAVRLLTKTAAVEYATRGCGSTPCTPASSPPR